jgi:hypothetical protein
MITSSGVVQDWTQAQASWPGVAEYVQDFTVATAPEQHERWCIFHIPDDHAMATWIRLTHPDWIDYSWATHANPLP